MSLYEFAAPRPRREYPVACTCGWQGKRAKLPIVCPESGNGGTHDVTAAPRQQGGTS